MDWFVSKSLTMGALFAKEVGGPSQGCQVSIYATWRFCASLALKGQCHEIFCFRFFSWITFPQAPDNNIRIISNFFENSRRYSQAKVLNFGVNDTGGKFCHQFPLGCWHRWQICHQCQRYRRQICRLCQWRRRRIATGINETSGK